MTGLVPVTPGSGTVSPLLAPLRAAAGEPLAGRLSAFGAQPAVRKTLPWIAGLTVTALAAAAWFTLAPAPQRILYTQLDDAERAAVASALDTASVDYTIDRETGALSVAEDDFYRARMLVASDDALATPESGTEMLDKLPMGASRTLEGDRLRAAQERDLVLTIQEIDGIEAVRVHLARAEPSVFVRDNLPPSASVMLRMARGRQLSDQQVEAIASLVAGSVPGLAIDAVRIVDQHGRLLSRGQSPESDLLELQSRMEAKLRTQIDQLLSPMIGAGNFSSEIQVDLDMSEVTSARESYDKDGVVRRESTQNSQSAATIAAGVPGVLSNTPPPAGRAVPGPPAGGAISSQPNSSGESSATRTYELGREVAVSSEAPGRLKRLSVAVALDKNALKRATPAELAKLEQLVSAAVGADARRGDTVAVVVRPFQSQEIEPSPFWETAWFATILRNVVALIAVLLFLLLAVRPAIRALTGRRRENGDEVVVSLPTNQDDGVPKFTHGTVSPDERREHLNTQIELAQRLVREKPDDALLALRRMLNAPATAGEPAP